MPCSSTINIVGAENGKKRELFYDIYTHAFIRFVELNI